MRVLRVVVDGDRLRLGPISPHVVLVAQCLEEHLLRVLDVVVWAGAFHMLRVLETCLKGHVEGRLLRELEVRVSDSRRLFSRGV